MSAFERRTCQWIGPSARRHRLADIGFDGLGRCRPPIVPYSVLPLSSPLWWWPGIGHVGAGDYHRRGQATQSGEGQSVVSTRSRMLMDSFVLWWGGHSFIYAAVCMVWCCRNREPWRQCPWMKDGSGRNTRMTPEESTRPHIDPAKQRTSRADSEYQRCTGRRTAARAEYFGFQLTKFGHQSFPSFST